MNPLHCDFEPMEGGFAIANSQNIGDVLYGTFACVRCLARQSGPIAMSLGGVGVPNFADNNSAICPSAVAGLCCTTFILDAMQAKACNPAPSERPVGAYVWDTRKGQRRSPRANGCCCDNLPP